MYYFSKMNREKILLSDLDIIILNYLKGERKTIEIMDKIGCYHSQYKRHLNRIKNYVTIRKEGNFRYIKINNKGLRILKVFNESWSKII